MKTDYIVKWSDRANRQLLKKADYIKRNSMSNDIAQKFFDDIVELTQKLSYAAGAYNDGAFHILPIKNGHSVRFIVVGGYAIITEFLPKGTNISR
ncbi:type II toxin-antitoxin system RelE/ParE family toxin [Caviibacterium pharyngocola]|uniref:Type II toxin-antitoxin system RelE/ParE family toxin n=1 Tax=Caviibacterium pharyngocola TaxID=28159 RepID=A0A2M8RT91_9PAST|nr:type II toxin-antitoxin system RelE/ParE family toxin [Caviibacterium pharyngocola]PJG82108.1 hypothetical protein CVP04_10660 [Caviibacterium pharyngocola]